MPGQVSERGISDRVFRAVYGVAHLGKSLTWYSSELLFAFFLTEVCGLTGAQMAVALAGSLVFSAGLDVGVGAILGRHVKTLLQACRLQAFGAVASGGALLLFACAGLIPSHHRFGYSTVAMLVFRLAYVVYDSPQNAVLGLVTAGSAERLNLLSVRFVFSAIATLVVAALAAPLLIGGRSSHAMNFAIYAAVLSVVGVVTGVALSTVARRRVIADAAATTPPAPPTIGAPPSLLGLAQLLTLIFLVAGAGSAFSRLEPYFAALALPDTATRSALLMGTAVGGLIGQPFWLWITRRNGWAAAARVASVLTVGAALGFFLFGARGPGPAIAAGSLFGLSVGGLNLLLWSALTETVAQGRTRLAPPLAFGLLVAVIKLSAAVSVIGVGVVLTLLRADMSGPPDALDFLTPMTATPILGGLICLVVLIWRTPSSRGASRVA